MEPEDATVQSGESVRFVCEVAGDPEPVVVSNLALDIRVSIKLDVRQKLQSRIQFETALVSCQNCGLGFILKPHWFQC